MESSFLALPSFLRSPSARGVSPVVFSSDSSMGIKESQDSSLFINGSRACTSGGACGLIRYNAQNPKPDDYRALTKKVPGP